MEELADKRILFLHRFLFLVFFSAVSLFYMSATAINKSAMFQITVRCYLTRVWRIKFSHMSLQVKFGVWRPLKSTV